jgi:hypothetical protein
VPPTARAPVAPASLTHCSDRAYQPLVKIGATTHPEEYAMSSPDTRQSHGPSTTPQDPVEAIVPAIPLVLPMVGGVLMFLLAFIAIYMA